MWEERDRLVAALAGVPEDDGYSLACVAGIDAETAIRLLGAESVEVTDDELEEWWDEGLDDLIGVTTVPGGCVLVQTWDFGASVPEVLGPLSAGTVAFGLYANPKSGNQGRVYRDGEVVEWDLDPGGLAIETATEQERLLAEAYRGEAKAFCCAYVGLSPTDDRAFTNPERWIRLPRS